MTKYWQMTEEQVWFTRIDGLIPIFLRCIIRLGIDRIIIYIKHAFSTYLIPLPRINNIFSKLRNLEKKNYFPQGRVKDGYFI